MTIKYGQRVSTREGLDYVLMLELKHLIKRSMDGIIDFPASVHGQVELNRLIRRMQNRVIDYPRGDNGEFALVEVMRLRLENKILDFPLLADGGTAGKIKTTNAMGFSIAGQVYTEPATDDNWDLSAFTPDTGAAEYQAVVLWLDAAGTATTSKLALAASEAAALALVDAAIVSNPTLCLVGVYVAGLSTDWNAGGGLAGQGNYYNGYPAARTTVAVTAELTARLVDGGTAGNIKLNQKLRFTIDGETHEKAITDDFWDLSAFTPDVGATEYAAVALYIDAAGAASMQQGTDQASAAAALAEVAALEVASKCVVGYFVGGNSCDWDDGGGLAGQGTYEQSPPAETTMSEATVAGTTLLADGSTAGKVKLSNQVAYKNNGKSYVKAATDDFWDLSAETDTTAAQYRAYGLCVNGGVAAVITGANKSTAALAIADLGEKLVTGQAIIGVYVADPSTDFDGGAGLLSFGTYHDGFPEALAVNDVSWVQ